MSVVGSLKLAIRDLLDGPPPRPRAAPAPLVRPPRVPGEPMTDKYLLQQIAVLRPPGSIIVEEAPSSRGPMHDYLPMVERDTFYTCASGGLGYGLPAAVGVTLGRPDRRVIALLGDGSSMYAIQGLWPAAQLRLPIAFIIVRNGRYEALHEFSRHFGLRDVPGTSLPDLDFCDLARGQGCKAERVGRADQLDKALQRAFAAREPMLVEVSVD